MKLSIAAKYLLSTLTVTNVSAQHLREAKRVPLKDLPEDRIHMEVFLKADLVQVEDDDIDQVNVTRNLKEGKGNKQKKEKANNKGKKKRKNKKGKGSKKAT